MGESVSATALRECLRQAALRRRLNEGADRVLQKLERAARVEGLHRAYLKTGGRVTMWDLLSADDLTTLGYVQTRRNPCTVSSEEPVKQDRVTCWISEVDPAGELWIGEPLTP